MFEYHVQVRMRHTDAAGVTFFAEQFALAHEAYEAFLESRKLGLRSFLQNGSVHLPIVHAEADYHAPLALGDRLCVAVSAPRVGSSSFVLEYNIRRADDETLATEVSTVHVAIDGTSHEKVALPSTLRAALSDVGP